MRGEPRSLELASAPLPGRLGEMDVGLVSLNLFRDFRGRLATAPESRQQFFLDAIE